MLDEFSRASDRMNETQNTNKVKNLRHNKIAVLSSLAYGSDLFLYHRDIHYCVKPWPGTMQIPVHRTGFLIHSTMHTQVHRRVNRHQFGANEHKALSGLAKTLTSCGGGLSVAPLPTFNGDPTTMGLRHLSHPAIAA
jgi:hypothetical protein